MKSVMTAVVVVAVPLVMAAAASVTGTWTMSVEGTPHGNATMGLVLTQDGTKVSGTFASGHGPDLAVTGEFAEGALKFETAGHGDSKILFSARLKDDGTLAGTISSKMGDMKWTASKAAAGKKDGK
jgi:hypothetical protein